MEGLGNPGRRGLLLTGRKETFRCDPARLFRNSAASVTALGTVWERLRRRGAVR